MESKIEILAVLFKERSEIDSKIEAVLDDVANSFMKKKAIKKMCDRIKSGNVHLGIDLAKEGGDETVEVIHRKKRAACLECGSRGPKHKAGCSKPVYKKPLSDSPAFFKTTGRPKKEIHSYQCRTCSTRFKSNLPKIDVFCPECRSVDVDDYEEKVIITKS